jgi:hypothetical protein
MAPDHPDAQCCARPGHAGAGTGLAVGRVTGSEDCREIRHLRGQRTAAGSWTVAAGQPGESDPASASSPASGIRGFQITAGGKTLVTVPVRNSPLVPPAGYLRQPDFS